MVSGMWVPMFVQFLVQVLHIVEKPDGIDFQFMGKQHAQKLADFINSFFPMRSKSSKQLTSHDSKSNTYNYKYTIFQEICPICKDDLVYLPGKVAAALGGLPQVRRAGRQTGLLWCVCSFMLGCVCVCAVDAVSEGVEQHPPDRPLHPADGRDPLRQILAVTLPGQYVTHTQCTHTTLATTDFVRPALSVCLSVFTRRHLTEFVILDVDTADDSRQHAPPAAAPAPAPPTPTNNRKNRRGNQSANTNATRGAKFVVCEAEVARACDFGKNDERVTVKTHLGHILKAGDYCLGYDLRTINVSGIDTELTEGQVGQWAGR